MFKQCPCCRKWLPISIAICICGMVFIESNFEDKKMPDHAHQETVQYFHYEGTGMTIGTATSSLSANFDNIFN